MMLKLRTEAPEVVEIYVLTKDFLHLHAGQRASVTDAHLCPEFLQCARKVSADSGWSQVFHAGVYAATKHLDNPSPPAPPRPRLPYAQVLSRLRLSEDEVVLLNFPKAAGTEYESRGTSIIGRTAMYSPDDIDRWLSLVRTLSARLPPTI